MKKFLSLLLVIALGAMLIISLNNNKAFSQFGDADLSNRVSQGYVDKNANGGTDVVNYGTSGHETGAANIVTSIVANYRSFDTLGEVTVLFIAALGVAMLLGTANTERLVLNFRPNFMLKIGAKALFGIILMTGVYMAIHGHLTPGGGFPGGSMIASAFLILYLADDKYRAKIKNFKFIESLSGVAYVAIGFVGLFVGGAFLYNFLPSGQIGQIFSAGIVPIVYVIIGLKVGAELSGILDNFLTEEGA